MDISDLPFNRRLGIAVCNSEETPSVTLQPAAHHLNHVNTLHATVVYGVAEAAAGQCLLLRFPTLTGSSMVLLRSSSVKYRKPALPEFELRAHGKIVDEAAEAFHNQITARGRAVVEVTVSVTQRDVLLLSGTFTWFASSRES